MSIVPSMDLPPRSLMVASPRMFLGAWSLQTGRPPSTFVSNRALAAAFRAAASALSASDSNAPIRTYTNCTSNHVFAPPMAPWRMQQMVGVEMRRKPSRWMSRSAVYFVLCHAMGPLPARFSSRLIEVLVSMSESS